MSFIPASAKLEKCSCESVSNRSIYLALDADCIRLLYAN